MRGAERIRLHRRSGLNTFVCKCVVYVDLPRGMYTHVGVYLFCTFQDVFLDVGRRKVSERQTNSTRERPLCFSRLLLLLLLFSLRWRF